MVRPDTKSSIENSPLLEPSDPGRTIRNSFPYRVTNEYDEVRYIAMQGDCPGEYIPLLEPSDLTIGPSP
jgi:hypothetical protein